LQELRKYVGGAILQWFRLEEGRYSQQDLAQSYRKKGSDFDKALYFQMIHKMSVLADISELDLHFFLICLDKIVRSMEELTKGEKKLKIDLKEVEKKMRVNEVKKGRHYFEHLIERIVENRSVDSFTDQSISKSLIFRFTGKEANSTFELDFGESYLQNVLTAYAKILEHFGNETRINH